MEELTIDNIGKEFNKVVESLNIISNFCKKNNISMRIGTKYGTYNHLWETDEKFDGKLTKINILND